MAASIIKNLISTNKVVIFTRTECRFCHRAKECFDQIGQKYEEINVDKRDDADDLMDALNEMTGARTVPRVFLNGTFIGGGMDIQKLHKQGELEKKCKSNE